MAVLSIKIHPESCDHFQVNADAFERKLREEFKEEYSSLVLTRHMSSDYERFEYGVAGFEAPGDKNESLRVEKRICGAFNSLKGRYK